MKAPHPNRTEFSQDDLAYLEWLKRAEPMGWRRYIDVQIPYRWNIRRLKPGRVLEIGAGVGRHLVHFQKGSVGIEINRAALQVLRHKGLTAYHPDEFPGSPHNQAAAFDSILLSHVAEHMNSADFRSTIAGVAHCLRPGGKLIVICPQEKGYATDSTHVEFMDHDKLLSAMAPLGFKEIRRYSFPFPRWAGRYFTHNEFVSVFTNT